MTGGHVDRSWSGLPSVKSVIHNAEAYGRRPGLESSTTEPRDEQHCRGQVEGLATRSFWQIRVAVLGWRAGPTASPIRQSLPNPRRAPLRPPKTRFRPRVRSPGAAPSAPSFPGVSRSSRCSKPWNEVGSPAQHPAANPALPPHCELRTRRTAAPDQPVGAIMRWCRSFSDEPESYHSPKAGVALPPRPEQISILAATPANYGRAGLVALAAFGLGVGAYLPWLSGTIDGLPFERTGLELGRSWGFTLARRRARARRASSACGYGRCAGST